MKLDSLMDQPKKSWRNSDIENSKTETRNIT